MSDSFRRKCTTVIKNLFLTAIFFGLVDRKCPMDPIAEIFQIKQCEKDDDCLPRICCPEKLRSGEIVGYCRTAEPIWDKMPIAKQLTERECRRKS